MTHSPRLTHARAPLVHEVSVIDEFGASRSISIPAERSLTVFVDNRELVTLMTLLMPWAVVANYNDQNTVFATLFPTASGLPDAPCSQRPARASPAHPPAAPQRCSR